MSAHTPEPWMVDVEQPWWVMGGELLASCSPEFCSPGMGTAQANAARIVDCVNALAGRDPSKLEALEKAIEHAASVFDEWSMPTPAVHLRAAIAAFRKEAQ